MVITSETSTPKHGSLAAKPKTRNNDSLFDRMFTITPFTRFYTIKSTGETNVTKLNMFKVDKELHQHIGVFERISEDFQNKSWTIEVRTASQGQKLLELKTLVSEPIIVTPHEHHNQSQGVITCPLLKGYTNEEINEGLSDHGQIVPDWL